MTLAMNMTPEERDRLKELEVKVRSNSNQIASMDEKLDRLIEAANMGKGAWWLMLKIGGILTVLSGLIIMAWGKVKGVFI